MQCAFDIKHAYLVDMPKTLSPYACAAKSLFSAKTGATSPTPVNGNFKVCVAALFDDSDLYCLRCSSGNLILCLVERSSSAFSGDI